MKRIFSLALMTLASACGSTETLSQSVDANNVAAVEKSSESDWSGQYSVYLNSNDKHCEPLVQTWQVSRDANNDYVVDMELGIDWSQKAQAQIVRQQLMWTVSRGYDYYYCVMQRTVGYLLEQDGETGRLTGKAYQSPYSVPVSCIGAVNLAPVPECRYSIVAVPF